MQNIIKDGQLVDDNWQLLRPDENGVLPAVADELDVIVPLASWLAAREAWLARSGQTAVWLSPSDDLTLLRPDLPSLPLIAIDFPSFTDGRGYSLARLLRERYTYAGELRALGDIWQDLVHYLWQVGFNAFEIKHGKNLQDAVKGYDTFSERYQATWRQPLPLFRRRITEK